MGSSRGVRRLLVLAAFAAAAAGPSRAWPDDAAAPPTVERIRLDEAAGHIDEALGGWAARYLGVPSAADRAAAMKGYVELAVKHPGEPDEWLLDAVQRSGAGIVLAAGRRVVVVASDELTTGVDAARLAAMADAAALAVERVCGAKPVGAQPAPKDKRPHDRAGRFVVAVGALPKPAGEQAFDAFAQIADDTPRGAGLVWSLVWTCAQDAMPRCPNHRASLLAPALSHVVRDFAVREIGEPSAVAACDRLRARAKERYEQEWAPGCLPGEWMPADEPMAWLFFSALDAERAVKRDPLDALHAILVEPRRDAGWRRFVAVSREMALEPFAAAGGASVADALRRAGVLPAGAALDDMKSRVAADESCIEAEQSRWSDARSAAAGAFHNAASTLGGTLASDALLLEALEIESSTGANDMKKARAAARKLSLLEGLDYLGPLPAMPDAQGVSAALRLMPFAVSLAPKRSPLKTDEPVRVSLKWDDAKDRPDEFLPRTPWDDKKGMSWGGGAVATTRWTKDLGRAIRVRPCLAGDPGPILLADGRPLDRWPDGSYVVPGAKGTEIVLASSSQIVCALTWRDARCVDEQVSIAASQADAVYALRPWASRRIAVALPAVVAALAKLPDDAIVREMKLLAPYRGGDAAACDAMLARAQGKPAVLAAYLDVCRGNRDPAVVDRLVALAAAPDSAPETLGAVQVVLEGVLFRQVAAKGADLPALWDRGRKWMAGVAFAEGEEIRDLYDSSPCFRVAAAPDAWGRACAAPASQWNRGRGEGYLRLELPESSQPAFLAVRWQPAGGRLTLHGYVTDGKKPRPFVVDLPGPAGEEPQWVIDVVELGQIPRGSVVFAFDDLCASGCKIDALAVGTKPLE